MLSIVKLLRLLADPTRLRLLALLEQGELSVAEIQEILGMGQSRISAHLAQLKIAQFARDRRAGKNIYYSLAKSKRYAQFHDLILAGAKEIPEIEKDKIAFKLAMKKRGDKTREYFNQLAGKFGRSYCPGRSWKGVSHLLLALIPKITVADLGAGEGTLSQLLAQHAKKVIAVDNSEKMVDFGSSLAKQHELANLEYRLGDIEKPPITAGSIDLAILSQALHHASQPPQAIAAAHRILKKGGRIAILDLLAHQFEKARDLYADLWLGFSEVELHQMLKDAGFRQIAISVVFREPEAPHFQTVLATAVK